jgi:hypothetical protein
VTAHDLTVAHQRDLGGIPYADRSDGRFLDIAVDPVRIWVDDRGGVDADIDVVAELRQALVTWPSAGETMRVRSRFSCARWSWALACVRLASALLVLRLERLDLQLRLVRDHELLDAIQLGLLNFQPVSVHSASNRGLLLAGYEYSARSPVMRSLDAWRALERAPALSTLIRQRRLTPSYGGHAPAAERTVGPARIVVESLTLRPGIRETRADVRRFATPC